MTATLPLAQLSLFVELPLLIVLISLVYSATRFDDWPGIIHEALRWMLRMGLFLVGIVLVLSGISLSDSSTVLRLALVAVGVGLEVSLLFIK
jgi:uncharacterized oligopeptide transporter (OPT) family protein